MTRFSSRVLLVGAGNMGGALLSGWMGAGMSSDYFRVVTPNPEKRENLRTRLGIAAVASVDDLGAFRPDAIILAVKPQILAGVLADYARFTGSGAVFISVAAGKTLAFLNAHLGGDAQLVRAMPNTPCLIGKGVTGLVARGTLSPAHTSLAETLFSAVGSTHWLESESQMNALIAVSGSGPAYMFLFLDYLTRAGVELGLSEALARKLACETMSGSAALALDADASLEQLRKQVTSPNGTTEAALSVFMQNDGFRLLVFNALSQAVKRAESLALEAK